MKVWDTVVIGGGIIGLSLALDLRRNGLRVIVLDTTQPGREASWAAGGMLAAHDPEIKPALRPLAIASANMYAEFVHQVQDESGERVDFRHDGTIRFLHEHEISRCSLPILTDNDLRELEPELLYRGPAVFLDENCVDPRLLMPALVKAARHHEVDIAASAEVEQIEILNDRAAAAITSKSRYPAAAIVNCAGAWAAQISPIKIPTRPLKGQMLSLAPFVTLSSVTTPRHLVRHVIRGDVYIIPRGDGRLVIGSTLEDVGFDKRVDAPTIQTLHQKAANLVPSIGEARILEDWAGLRPGTPDGLPVLGHTEADGYFVATGHYRDGILLAPATAKLMSRLIRGEDPVIDLSPFSLTRFQVSESRKTQ